LTVSLWYAECSGQDWSGDNFKPTVAKFQKIIVDRTGKSLESLTRGERDKESQKIMLELMISHPQVIASKLVKRGVKILFAPVDGLARWIVRIMNNENNLPSAVRGAVFLLCLPFWLLAYFPSKKLCEEYGAYLIFYGLMLSYVLLISALGGDGQGARYRFPMLMMICSTAAIQVDFLARKFHLTALLHSGQSGE
jgi:hypothetical protein